MTCACARVIVCLIVCVHAWTRFVQFFNLAFDDNPASSKAGQAAIHNNGRLTTANDDCKKKNKIENTQWTFYTRSCSLETADVI